MIIGALWVSFPFPCILPHVSLKGTVMYTVKSMYRLIQRIIYIYVNIYVLLKDSPSNHTVLGKTAQQIVRAHTFTKPVSVAKRVGKMAQWLRVRTALAF